MYSPWHLGMRELLTTEGKYAAMALNMNFFIPVTSAHGEILSYYPLYPWIVSIAYKCGLNLEFGLRLISILSLAGLGIIVFVVVRRAWGFHEAIVSTSFMIGNMLVFEKAIDGNPFLTGEMLLVLAWLLWYHNGIVKNNWNKAWIYSSIFCGLSFYTMGWASVFYFFLPLIFMRRPLTLWKKLNYRGFKIGIIIIVCFLLLWLLPRMLLIIQSPIAQNSFNNIFTQHYISDVLLYPLAVIGGLLPWIILAWPAFCVAYYPLDKNPIFSRFIRIIFLTILVIIWFNPFTEARDLMLLVPPLAILVGANYQILIRRHGKGLHQFFLFLLIIMLILSGLILFAFLMPFSMWENSPIFQYIHTAFLPNGIEFFKEYKIWGIVQSSSALLFGIIILLFLKLKKLSIYVHGLSICIILMLCFWSVTYPYRSQENEARKTASKFINLMGSQYSEDMIIYKIPQISDIYVLGCYLKADIKNFIPSKNKSKDVYLFSVEQPAYQGFNWNMLGSESYKGKSLSLWKGVREQKTLIFQ